MSHALLNQIQLVLEDIQAQNIVQIDVRSMTSITDHMVVCTGRSNRHLRSIAKSLKDKLGHEYAVRIDGMDSSEWILVDAKDVIVHIMSPEARGFYRLESLWGKDVEPTGD
jgi:ribosome-associated protein